jgi:hypothetical protein
MYCVVDQLAKKLSSLCAVSVLTSIFNTALLLSAISQFDPVYHFLTGFFKLLLILSIYADI